LGQTTTKVGQPKTKENELLMLEGGDRALQQSRLVVHQEHQTGWVHQGLSVCPWPLGGEICLKFHVLGHCPLGKDCTRRTCHCALPEEAAAPSTNLPRPPARPTSTAEDPEQPKQQTGMPATVALDPIPIDAVDFHWIPQSHLELNRHADRPTTQIVPVPDERQGK